MPQSAATRDVVRAISGPLLLIVTGVLFLVDYSGGYRVSQTWPVLLIVLGVAKVLEYLVAPPPRPKPPSY
jgi:hypothetical protein